MVSPSLTYILPSNRIHNAYFKTSHQTLDAWATALNAYKLPLALYRYLLIRHPLVWKSKLKVNSEERGKTESFRVTEDFVLKVILAESSLFSFFAAFFLTVIWLGFQVRVFERPLYEHPDSIYL